MLNASSLTITPYISASRPAVRRLLAHHRHLHLHLDWQDPDSWISRPETMACLGWQGRELAGLMAASPPRGGACWLRLIALEAGVPVQAGLRALWDGLRPMLANTGARQVFVLGIAPWLEQAVEMLGFDRFEEVVTLRRLGGPQQPIPPPLRDDLRLRPVELPDLPAVLAVDHAAFDAPWQFEAEDLEAILRRPLSFTLAEYGGSLVGYEISLGYEDGGHVSRLATVPEMQGQGVGGALLRRALLAFEESGARAVTLNTQQSNTASQRLYRRFGFELTGSGISVWQIAL